MSETLVARWSLIVMGLNLHLSMLFHRVDNLVLTEHQKTWMGMIGADLGEVQWRGGGGEGGLNLFFFF